MRDLVDNIGVSQILNPVNATTTRISNSVDRQGYNSLLMVVNVGQSLDTLSGSIYWTIKPQHSDDNSSFSDCATDDVQGGVASYVVNSSSLDRAAYKFGYKGSKRYVRITAVNTGTHTNGTTYAATALRSNPAVAPVA